MIFEVKCDELTYLLTYEELTDRTHTRIVSFIVLDSCSIPRAGLGVPHHQGGVDEPPAAHSGRDGRD